MDKLKTLIKLAEEGPNLLEDDRIEHPVSEILPVTGEVKAPIQRAHALLPRTKKSAGTNTLPTEHINITTCLNELRDLVSQTWDPRIRLELQINAIIPPITCNRVEFQSAVLSLLLNAVEAMPSGGKILLAARLIQPSASTLELELQVIDNGHGMSRETLGQIFEPFFTTKAKGLGGLGLFLVRRFAEGLGGGLEIDSVLGLGTTASLNFPIDPDVKIAL
ncbi:MAG: ATP-binding protein [Rhodobacteraceae bacterium]|nr:ATP-binding protein [Paracoccaceae bacterium]